MTLDEHRAVLASMTAERERAMISAMEEAQKLWYQQLPEAEKAKYRSAELAIHCLSPQAQEMIRTLVETGRYFADFVVDVVLAVSEQPGDIAALEIIAEKSQAEAVDSYIEDMHPTLKGQALSPGVPELTGGRGTREERRAAVIAHFRAKIFRANDNPNRAPPAAD
jgi:hypothetical protein